MESDPRGEIKGLLSICFNPLGLAPDAEFTRGGARQLEFFGVIDFFLSGDRAARRRRARRQPAREDEGSGRDRRGRGYTSQQASAAGRRSTDWAIYCDLAPGSGTGRSSPTVPRGIFDELRGLQGRPADYNGITYEKIDAQNGRLLALSHDGPSRHPAAVRGRPLLPRRRRAPMQVTEVRPGAAIPTRRIRSTDHRRVSTIPLGTQTAADRRPRRCLLRAEGRDPSALAEELGSSRTIG
jgi:predicted molibdopterin-dependent oxidoreductase YjgC